MNIKYQYAYNKDKNIVNITDATKGASYYCISCNDTLITKQGKIKKWHFAHKHEQANCSVESYLHKLAKQRFYDTYNDCLANNKPFYIEIKSYEQYEPCQANKEFNTCKKCDYRRTKTDKIDLTKWFKNIEIERTVEAFKADVCLSTIDDSDKIFIEIHVTNKISENKESSKYRIIEIDIDTENDLLCFDSKNLAPSEKIRFINFKNPKKTVSNDGKCKKTFLFLFLNKNGRVLFKKDLNIVDLNVQLSHEQSNNNVVEYRIVSAQPCDDYADYEYCVDFYDGAGSSEDYKNFIADCANKKLNVKSCFICRYHAEANREWSIAPIFCKFLKEECASTKAVKCQYFKKEDKYIKDLLKTNVKN